MHFPKTDFGTEIMPVGGYAGPDNAESHTSY